MGRFTRGFAGRGRAERDPRLPPGQYDTGKHLAGAHRRGDAAARHRRRGRFASKASSTGRRPGRGTRSTRCRRRATRATSTASPRGRSSASTSLASRSTRCSTRPACAPSASHVLAFSHTGVHDEPSARRRDRRPGVGRLGLRGTPAAGASTAARRACSCRTCTSGRAPSGSPACACSTTTSPASGSRTAITTAATRGSNSATRATER